MRPVLWALLAVTGCGQMEREPQMTWTSVRALQSAPDFVVAAITGPASVQSGQGFTAQVTVCNQGTVTELADVELYLSVGTLIRPRTPSGPSEDSMLGGRGLPPLAPGQCITVARPGQAMPPGPNAPGCDQGYYLGAVVDPRNSRPELLEDNNTFVGKRMGVGSGSDFIVTAVSGPTSGAWGQPISVQVTVCNQG